MKNLIETKRITPMRTKIIVTVAVAVIYFILLFLYSEHGKTEQEQQPVTINQLKSLNDVCVKTGQKTFTEQQLSVMTQAEARQLLLTCSRTYESLERQKVVTEIVQFGK